ncbi:MAG: 50S ribosomal protein L5 [bacterium]
MSGLQTKYRQEIAPALKEVLHMGNIMQVPRVLKVAINMGFNSQVDKEMIKNIIGDMAKLSGQKPVLTKARKSISNFKVREGVPVGVKVTLRGKRMYDFLERMMAAALPRIRDFRGLPTRGFDGRGSYTFGLQEQTVFPEINPDGVKRVQGMDVTIVTSAATDAAARELLVRLGLPLAGTHK